MPKAMPKETLLQKRGKKGLQVTVPPRVTALRPRVDWVKKDGEWWKVTRDFSGGPPYTDKWEKGFEGKWV